MHDPDTLVNIIDQQRRDQAVIEANDAARWQTPQRWDSKSVAAAETNLQGNAAGKHYANQSAKTAGVKTEWNRRYDNKECFVSGKQGSEQWDCPQSQQGNVGKGVHGQSHGQDPAAAASAAAAIHKRSRSAYPEQSHRDGPYVCHPYGWS